MINLKINPQNKGFRSPTKGVSSPDGTIDEAVKAESSPFDESSNPQN